MATQLVPALVVGAAGRFTVLICGCGAAHAWSLTHWSLSGPREGGRMREDTEATPKLERAEAEGGGGEAGDRNRDEGVCNGTFLDGFR